MSPCVFLRATIAPWLGMSSWPCILSWNWRINSRHSLEFSVFSLHNAKKHKYKPISNLSLVLALPYYTHFVVENKLTFNSLKVAKQEMELMPQGRQSPALCDWHGHGHQKSMAVKSVSLRWTLTRPTCSALCSLVGTGCVWPQTAHHHMVPMKLLVYAVCPSYQNRG